MRKQDHPLMFRFVHIPYPHLLPDEWRCEYQGQIVEVLSMPWVQVDLYSWSTGEFTESRLFEHKPEAMWRIYGSEQDWKNAGDRIVKSLLIEAGDG